MTMLGPKSRPSTYWGLNRIFPILNATPLSSRSLSLPTFVEANTYGSLTVRIVNYHIHFLLKVKHTETVVGIIIANFLHPVIGLNAMTILIRSLFVC